MFVVKLVFFPLKVGAKATKVAAKTGTKATTMAAKTGYRTGRLLGYRRMFVFALGVGVGLLLAPGPGRELREKLKAMLQGEPVDTTPTTTTAYTPTAASPLPASEPLLSTTTGTNGHN
jgi:hypothetical protein